VIAVSSAYGTQSLTLAIPLGFFIVMLVVAFFQRHPSR
jgi:hypothetical protein